MLHNILCRNYGSRDISKETLKNIERLSGVKLI